MADLSATIQRLERDPSFQGMILTSAIPKVFSAGLNYKYVINPKEEEFKEYWAQYEELWRVLYGTSLATVAAINGTCFAAGCVLAMSCDHRVMIDSEKYKIGLNEASINLTPAVWMRRLVARNIGEREAERLIQLGTLLTPRQALDIKLVDTLAASDDLMDTSVEELQKWLDVPQLARANTKRLQRAGLLARANEQSMDDMWRTVSAPAFQEGVAKAVSNLGVTKQSRKYDAV
eukprot:Colp12_sorted_trinity150504_noHs@20597